MKQIRLLSWLYKRTRNSAGVLILIGVFSVILMATNVIGPRIISMLIDQVSAETSRNLMLRYALAYIMVQLLQGGTEWGLAVFELEIGQKIIRQITHDLTLAILKDPNAVYTTQDPGDLLEVLTNDAENVKTFYSETITNILLYLVVSISCILSIFKQDAIVGFMSVAALAAVGVGQSLLPKIVHRQFLLLKDNSIRYTGFLQNIVSNVLSVIAANVTSRVVGCGEKRLENKQKTEKTINLTYSTNSFLLTVISTAALILIGLLCINKIRNGVMTIGIMFSLVIYFQKAFGEVLKLVMTTMNVQEGLVSVERIHERLETYECRKEEVKHSNDIPAPSEILFTNLSVKYAERDAWVLRGFDGKIQRGKLTIVKGKNGSGKSTLLRLLYKIITDYEGSICWDNQDIRNINNDFLRSQISYIPQDGHIFPGSVRENITLGEEYEGCDIEKALRIVGLDDVLQTKNNGVDEEVDLDGQNFSGGELQKMVIARELLRNRSILFLDEATRSIDAQSVHQILTYFEQIKQDKVIVIVTHDSTIQGDEVICLDENDSNSRNCVCFKEER